MTESDDRLIERLRAADPVDPTTLPSPSDPTPQLLLENLMTPHPDTPTLDTAPDEVPYPFPELAERRRRSFLGGRGMLLGAVAAVVILLAGVLVLAPENTTPAVATVHSAAQATADADTKRIETVFQVNGTEDGEERELGGQLDAAFSGDDLSLSVSAQSDDPSIVEELGDVELRVVDDTLYVQQDSQWYATGTDGFIGRMVSDYVDPRSVLETVQSLVETTEVDSVDVDGVETTHYQSVVDLQDETLQQSGWLAMEGIDIDTEGEVTVDLFVDDDGVLRRIDVGGDLQDIDGSDDDATFTISTRFYDIGADITIEAPADAEEFDPLSFFDE